MATITSKLLVVAGFIGALATQHGLAHEIPLRCSSADGSIKLVHRLGIPSSNLT